MKKKILLIEDDKNFVAVLKDFLEKNGFKVRVSYSGSEALSFIHEESYDVFLIDQNLPDKEGVELTREIIELLPGAAVVIMTAYPDTRKAVKALKMGVVNYLIKPFAPEELLEEITKTLELREYESLKDLRSFSLQKETENIIIIGESEASHKLREFIDIASRFPETPVLLTGETGTGKSLAAKAIHYKSPLREKPFLVINCAAIPESLLEAELFGYERGAFTGATRSRKGMFELANGGTLFLDEIGDMPLTMQAKILHVLDSGKIRRLGSEKEIPIKVRIIAATNKDVEQLLERKEFRNDLYYRLAVLKYELPPLRERKSDIIPLANHFLKQLSRGRINQLSEEDKFLLLNYDFPGNIRELRNIIERALILSRDGKFSLKRVLNPPYRKNDSNGTNLSNETHFPPLEEVVKEHVLKAMTLTGGNKAKAARLLGISLSTLKRWLRKWSK